MSCAHQNQEFAIGLILGKFTVYPEGVGVGVGALMSCARQDRECAIVLILGKFTIATGEGVGH